MLQDIDVVGRRLDAYADIVSRDLLDEIGRLGGELRGARIVHVNSASRGGGVAELLEGTVPLLRDAGIAAEWKVIEGDDAFFGITKKLHNALQGDGRSLSSDEVSSYLRYGERLAPHLDRLGADLLVIHDPQPLSARSFMRTDPVSVARLHLDLSAPNPEATAVIMPHLRLFGAVMVSLPEYAPDGLDASAVRIAPPAIDPFSLKNAAIGAARKDAVLSALGITVGEPLLVQISRFDPWKDPLGVIEAYRLVRERVPGCRLVLAGSAPSDDPEAAGILARVRREAGDDPDIFVFSDDRGPRIGAAEVNILQAEADVVLQKSLREGFGLTVTEAMWKGAAVVGGDVAGIRAQIDDGMDGFLVGNIEECASRTVELLRDPDLRARIGRNARESVRARFLLPRLVRDHLRTYRDLLRHGRREPGAVD